MRSRWALPDERTQLQALWELCFSDGSEISGAFFDAFTPQRHTRVIAAQGRVVSMVSWMPVTLCDGHNERKGAYLYAVATASAFRGQGLCRALMEETEQCLWEQGMEFTALWPAEASLFGFYGAMGYVPAFPCDNRRVGPNAEKISLTEISAEQYRALRESLLPRPFCRWNEAAFSYLVKTQVRFYTFPGGCAAAFPLPDGGIRVPELLGGDAEALCCALHAPYAIVTMPGDAQPQGMMKWHTGVQEQLPIYLGFAFD